VSDDRARPFDRDGRTHRRWSAVYVLLIVQPVAIRLARGEIEALRHIVAGCPAMWPGLAHDRLKKNIEGTFDRSGSARQVCRNRELRMTMKLILAAATLALAAPAMAKDTDDCLPGLICASTPETIVKAIQAAGYKAKLTKDDSGDPKIDSAAAGYDFQVYFYDCEKHLQCSSIQFVISFNHEGYEDAVLAEQWNENSRMGKAYLEKDGGLTVRHDISTVGGLNQKNFEDTLNWWSTTLGDVAEFWKKHPNPKKKA
jgi:hypothetical protein